METVNLTFDLIFYHSATPSAVPPCHLRRTNNHLVYSINTLTHAQFQSCEVQMNRIEMIAAGCKQARWVWPADILRAGIGGSVWAEHLYPLSTARGSPHGLHRWPAAAFAPSVSSRCTVYMDTYILTHICTHTRQCKMQSWTQVAGEPKTVSLPRYDQVSSTQRMVYICSLRFAI